MLTSIALLLSIRCTQVYCWDYLLSWMGENPLWTRQDPMHFNKNRIEKFIQKMHWIICTNKMHTRARAREFFFYFLLPIRRNAETWKVCEISGRKFNLLTKLFIPSEDRALRCLHKNTLNLSHTLDILSMCLLKSDHWRNFTCIRYFTDMVNLIKTFPSQVVAHNAPRKSREKN